MSDNFGLAIYFCRIQSPNIPAQSADQNQRIHNQNPARSNDIGFFRDAEFYFDGQFFFVNQKIQKNFRKKHLRKHRKNKNNKILNKIRQKYRFDRLQIRTQNGENSGKNQNTNQQNYKNQKSINQPNTKKFSRVFSS